jgi:UDP-N-acetylmuramoyl-L-alanyl-D-glutamate--2,6-diaminopimelate ligase
VILDRAELARVLGTEIPPGVDEGVRGVAYDSRRVKPGFAFVAIPGFKRDGAEFAPEALRRGASLVVAEREVPEVPTAVVPDARTALAALARAVFGDPSGSMQVYGVTGTNGKTTTAYALHSILAGAYGEGMCGLMTTVETISAGERRPAVRTTPEAVEVQETLARMLEAGVRRVVMEVSSHGIELGRVSGTRFEGALFTNLTRDHLDLHGTMEAYFDAKQRLFTEPDVDGKRPRAAINVGDAHGRLLSERLLELGERPLSFGLGDDAEIRPETLELGRAGTCLRVDGLEIESRLRGRFNVENILGAVAAARLLGIEDEAIVRGVEHVAGVPGRFEAVDEGQPFAVLVDYAHTPEALENVLSEARGLAAERVICVFGCGGDRDRAKRPLMGEVASRLADRVIVTSDNPRSEEPLVIIEDILEGVNGEHEVEPDRAAAIGRAIVEARAGDVVIIAGKGHEQGQEFADRLLPFDDREVAGDALRRLGAGAAA